MGKSYELFYDRAYTYCRKTSPDRDIPFDLCPNEAAVLFLMLSAPQVDTAKSISERLSMAPALVSRVLDGLARKEYVQTQRDKQDRRLYRITFSPAREKDLAMLKEMCSDFNTQLTAGISREDIDVSTRVLDQMKKNCAMAEE